MSLWQLPFSRGAASVALSILIGSVAIGQPGGTTFVRHAPSVNGTIEGSVRQLLPESAVLAGNARITGDWLVPGTPALRVTGAAKYAGVFEAGGPAEPTNYQIMLGGTVTLGRLGQRTPSVVLPTVNPPAFPVGTRDVTITATDANLGDWSTLRDLTLNRSGADPMPVPPGEYGAFVVHHGSLILGNPGATSPARYSFERLIVTGTAEIRVAGPVIVTLRESFSTNGKVGSSDHPGWLQLRIASGGLSLEGNAAFYGVAIAPAGTVTLGGTSELVGQTISDGLTVAGGATLRVLSFAKLLPYVADFEAAEGYSSGSLLGQQGWSISQGLANVSASAAFSGANSVIIPAGSPPGRIVQTFIPRTGEGIVFVDFMAKPVADLSLANSSIFDVDHARLAFGRTALGAVLHAFQGDGVGGGQWVPTKFTSPLGADLQLQNWVRLTARLDFTKKQWDLYAGGQMVATDVRFRDSTAGSLTLFAVQGNAAADTRIDYLLAGSDNPLFVDADNDGLDDAWEVRYGLNPTVNDRYATPAGNGIPVVQAYVNGTNPNDYYQGVAPVITVVAGSTGQAGPQGLVSARVTASNGTALPNAPVRISVTTGSSRLSASPGGTPVSGALNLRTDAQGIAAFYLTFTTYKPETVVVTGGLRTISFAIDPPETDMDGNGLPDLWETTYFGRTGIEPTGDTDGDGIGNLQEWKSGTDPTDYFNGVLPVITSQVGSNGELAPDGSLWLKVTNAAGTPLLNAPVQFNVKQGGHHLAAAPGGPPVDEITVRSDASGIAKVYILPGNN